MTVSFWVTVTVAWPLQPSVPVSEPEPVAVGPAPSVDEATKTVTVEVAVEVLKTVVVDSPATCSLPPGVYIC